MAQHFYPDQSRWLRKGSRQVLAFCWISGLICGILVFLTASDSLFPLMRSIPFGTVSIVGVLYASVLPFLLSVFLVLLDRPVLIFLLCFFKAFLLTYLSLGILRHFGSAGWVFQCLLLFSELISTPLLYCFWHRNVARKVVLCWQEASAVLALVILAGSIDFCIISPFLASLIDF